VYSFCGDEFPILLFSCFPLLKYSPRWTWLSLCPGGSWSHHAGMSETSMPMSLNVDVRSLETEYSISGFFAQAAIPFSLPSSVLNAHGLSSSCVYVNSTATSPFRFAFSVSTTHRFRYFFFSLLVPRHGEFLRLLRCLCAVSLWVSG